MKITGKIMEFKNWRFDEIVLKLENKNIVSSKEAEKHLYYSSTYPFNFFNIEMSIEEIKSEYERLKPITSKKKRELDQQYKLFIKINEAQELGLLEDEYIENYKGKYDKRTIDFIKCQFLKEDGPSDEEIERTCNYLNDEELCKEIYELGCKFINEEIISMATGIGSMA